MIAAAKPRTIHSVSDLTSKIKVLLEETFPFVWIYGEISNFRRPASGHFYFTLKDDKAQIPAVMFRGQQSGLKFRPEDGLEITGLGRIAVYEPRGVYQIILEYMEPKGIGALQKAFEQLKARLAEEGLFEAARKKPIPSLPAKIALVTSPTGAVVRDMLHILRRRFDNIEILILPVKVQGEGAVEEIVEAIGDLSRCRDVDVAILARGGGSLEDLWAFNSEKVARAVSASEIPIISAIGHETDYTIADFVADLRAPTPSAAAELAVPVKNELLFRRTELSDALFRAMLRVLSEKRNRLAQGAGRLVHPRKRIQDSLLKLDDLELRLGRAAKGIVCRSRELLEWRLEKLRVASPRSKVENFNVKLEQIDYKLLSLLNIVIAKNKARFKEAVSELTALSPMAILTRGYGIARLLPERSILRDADAAPAGSRVELTLSRGALLCRVEGKK